MNCRKPSYSVMTGVLVCIMASCAPTPPLAGSGLAAAGLPVVGTASAQDSPCFRGPSRNGTYPDATIRTNWKEKPPKILWRKDVGYGFSSVVVAGNKIVTAGYAADGAKSAVYCFNADTGAQIWRTEYADTRGGPRGKVPVSGPVATPVIDGDRVYMVAVMGALYCMDLNDGSNVWVKITNADGGKCGEFGDGAPPVIAGDLVLAHLTTAAGSASWFAFNKNDGSVAWSIPVTTRLGKDEDADRGYSPAGLCKVSGKSCALFVSDAAIDCVELAKGVKMWSHNIADLELRYGPFEEPVFYGPDKFLLSIWYANKPSVIAFQIDSGGLTRIWSSKAIGKGAYSCVVCNGFAFGYGVEGLNCVDLLNGESKWNWRSSNPRMARDQGEVILVGDKLVWVASYSGMLYVGNASSEKSPPLGELKALNECTKDLKKDKATYNNVVSTAPVFANGRVYLRSPWGELTCVDVR